MEILINFACAWIAVGLTICLSMIYLLRKIGCKKDKTIPPLMKLNKFLRKYHKGMGILLVITGLIHGYFSSVDVWSFNMGTVCWIISILLGLNYAFRKQLAPLAKWMPLHRVLTLVFLVTLLLHIDEVGGIRVFELMANGSQETTEVYASLQNNENDLSQYGQFKDGVYVGEASGYRPNLKVEIEISDNKIVSLQITEHQEVNSRFYQPAMESVPQDILDEQSTEVDTVSGSTYTSIGIMNATKDALSQALIEGSVPDSTDLPSGVNGGHGGHEQHHGGNFGH